MNYTAIESRKELIRDTASLKVILYLAEYNPNVKMETLEEALQIPEVELIPIMHKLINHNIVCFNNDKNTYELSPFGKNIVKNLRRI